MSNIRLHQLSPQAGHPAANQQLIEQSIAASHSADLLVLPELASSGYMLRDPGEVREVALRLDGPEIHRWIAAIPGDTIVVCGFPELADDGHLYNSAIMFDRAGILVSYRKVHLWDSETQLFTPGHEPAPIAPTPLGNLGMMICYDIEFPEYTRSAALRGADALVVPTNWPLVPRPGGERPPEVLIAQAAARVNKMALLLCDRTGSERGQEWTAGTSIINHEGWVIAEHPHEGILTAELDLTAGRDKKISNHNHLFQDRRPQTYLI